MAECPKEGHSALRLALHGSNGGVPKGRAFRPTVGIAWFEWRSAQKRGIPPYGWHCMVRMAECPKEGHSALREGLEGEELVAVGFVLFSAQGDLGR